ncbi:MAG TPA: hypothetical protein VEH79_00125 [Gaiellaceae bacterium]|nr:hypothetical protein [Gaiellaceae bacterium]
MSLTISPPIRIVAIAGLLLAVVFGGYTMTLGRSHSSSATKTPVSTPGKTVTTHRSAVPVKTETPAHKTSTTERKTTPAAAAKTATTAKTTTAKTAAKHTVAKQTAAKHAAAHRGNLVDATLPQALQWQLSQHKVVVVSVYDPDASVDAISVAEAHAGAEEAGAGFLLVNVLDNSLAGLLTGVLPGGGLLPDPGVLIYRAPGTLALRIDGFADRDAVAQAAADALAGQDGPTTAPAEPTITTP